MDRKLLLAAALAAALPSAAFAADEDRIFATAMLQYDMFDDARPLENDFGAQLGIGFPVFDNLALELNYQMVSAGIKGGGSADISGYGLDAMWFFDRNGALDAYVLLGVGRNSVEVGSFDDDFQSTEFGIGLMDAITDNLTFRAELRAIRSDETVTATDLALGIGVSYLFGEPTKTVVPAAKPVDRDSDGDGVMDSADRCPGTALGARVDGAGCVLPPPPPVEMDSDGDGVMDGADRCPNTPRGVAVLTDGCAPDSDGDGVRDPMDKCPATPAGAKVLADGCPVPVTIELQGVTFETNSDVITAGSRAKLDEAVATLMANPTVKVEVAGHTDGMGDANANRALSQRRADAVRSYLLNGGVAADQVSARGYGEDEPIASNDTAEGRAQNRRVELKVQK